MCYGSWTLRWFWVLSSGFNMLAASSHFAVATTWCSKPVRLCIWSPMTMQVRDYLAAWSSHLSGTHMPIKGEGVDTQPLPSEPHLDNGPQMELTTRDLWDLDNDQLQEALEVVQFKTARKEGAAPTHNSP